MFTFGVTVCSMGAMVARLGLDNVLVKCVAAASVSGDSARSHSVIAKALQIAIIAAIAATIILGISAVTIAGVFLADPRLEGSLLVSVLGIFPLAVGWLLAEAHRGTGRIGTYQTLQSIVIPACALTAILLIPPFILNEYTPLVAYMVAIWVMALIAILSAWARRLVVVSARNSVPALTLLSSSLPMLAIAGSAMLTEWVPSLILGTIDTEELGRFGMALRVAGLLGFLLMAATSVAAPKLAASFAANDKRQLEDVARYTTRLVLVVGFPAYLILFGFADEIMNIFGSDFRTTGNLLRILATGQFLSLTAGCVGYLLLMTGNERSMLGVAGMGTLVIFVTSLLLIPPLGATGAAYATAATVAIRNLLAAMVVKRRLGFTPLFGAMRW